MGFCHFQSGFSKCSKPFLHLKTCSWPFGSWSRKISPARTGVCWSASPCRINAGNVPGTARMETGWDQIPTSWGEFILVIVTKLKLRWFWGSFPLVAICTNCWAPYPAWASPSQSATQPPSPESSPRPPGPASGQPAHYGASPRARASSRGCWCSSAPSPVALADPGRRTRPGIFRKGWRCWRLVDLIRHDVQYAIVAIGQVSWDVEAPAPGIGLIWAKKVKPTVRIQKSWWVKMEDLGDHRC